MKIIKNYENFVNENKVDESFRQLKAWLQIPKIIFETLLSKIINFVPRLSFRYDQLSANIDFGHSLSKGKINTEPQKLKINDIKNKAMRNTLISTGIFETWNIYYMNTIDSNRNFNVSDNSRDVIYITKDELKIGDYFYGDRISESEFNKDYKKSKGNIKKILRNNPESEKFADIEPQIFVVAAIDSKEHKKMNNERENRYADKNRKELEKLVNKCIKDDNMLGYSSAIFNDWSRDPILAKVVRADRLDLAKKLVNACYDADELIEMIEEEYGETESKNVFKEKNISDDMKHFLSQTLRIAKETGESN